MRRQANRQSPLTIPVGLLQMLGRTLRAAAVRRPPSALSKNDQLLLSKSDPPVGIVRGQGSPEATSEASLLLMTHDLTATLIYLESVEDARRRGSESRPLVAMNEKIRVASQSSLSKCLLGNEEVVRGNEGKLNRRKIEKKGSAQAWGLAPAPAFI